MSKPAISLSMRQYRKKTGVLRRPSGSSAAFQPRENLLLERVAQTERDDARISTVVRRRHADSVRKKVVARQLLVGDLRPARVQRGALGQIELVADVHVAGPGVRVERRWRRGAGRS